MNFIKTPRSLRRNRLSMYMKNIAVREKIKHPVTGEKQRNEDDE